MIEDTTACNDEDAPQTIFDRMKDKYGLEFVDAETNEKNNGAHPNNLASAGSTIYFNKFDDPDIEVIAFFHELGHVEAGRSLSLAHYRSSLCKLSQESVAWELGLNIAAREGYTWAYNSKELRYARECLKSYLNYEGPLGGFE